MINEFKNEIKVLYEALELCSRAADGSFVAWPKNMEDEFRSGTEMGWRVNRVGEIVRAVKNGSYNGRETYSHE